MSSPGSYDDWFAELENIDYYDPTLLQEFIGDCLVDYQPENMAGLTEDPELHNNSLLASSECNSPTAATATVLQQLQPPIDVGQKRPRRATTKTTKRPRKEPNECLNHVMAERLRRQTVSQRLLALAALIPGLKKMDKTTVLGEAITYMKELEQRVKILEKKNAKKAVDSVYVVKRSRVNTVENECHSSTSQSSPASSVTNDDQLPEIETRFTDTSVLIKIHCRMQTGVLAKIMNHIDNLNLLVISSNSIAFNSSTLDINIVAEMEADFDMRPQEVVDYIRSIF